jgi:hypothetical protein
MTSFLAVERKMPPKTVAEASIFGGKFTVNLFLR